MDRARSTESSLSRRSANARPQVSLERYSDGRFVRPGWRRKLESVPRERRALFGLQLFPEASIDYWIGNVDLIDHENLVVRAARAFCEAGFTVVVKDHPLQFGFRQTELIDRLRALSSVIMVPYDVTGNEVLALCGVNFTFTGTMGLQAACSVSSPSLPNRTFLTTGISLSLDTR